MPTYNYCAEQLNYQCGHNQWHIGGAKRRRGARKCSGGCYNAFSVHITFLTLFIITGDSITSRRRLGTLTPTTLKGLSYEFWNRDYTKITRPGHEFLTPVSSFGFKFKGHPATGRIKAEFSVAKLQSQILGLWLRKIANWRLIIGTVFGTKFASEFGWICWLSRFPSIPLRAFPNRKGR